MKEKEIEERTSGKMGYYRHRLGEREKIKKETIAAQTTPPRCMDAERYRKRVTLDDLHSVVGASVRSFRSVPFEEKERLYIVDSTYRIYSLMMMILLYS